MKNLHEIILKGIIIFMLIAATLEFKSCADKVSENPTINIDDDNGLEASKKIYTQGYEDGQTGFGLPPASQADALDLYMAKGYNFSQADFNVYVMGYNDGIKGRKRRY